MRLYIFLSFIFVFCACSSKINTFIQTNNEGIFIKTTPAKSVSINIQNASFIENSLEAKLEKALISKGFNVFSNKENADFELLLNLIDFKKNAYTQRVNGSAATFFYGAFITNYYNYEIENFYSMQVNLQITNNATKESQKTSLIARTAYLSAVEKSKEALEDKIIAQILSFFIQNNLNCIILNFCV